MKILIATSTTDFDPSEVALPWQILSNAGIDVHFATDTGTMGAADEHMLKGDYFGFLAKFLVARQDAQDAYVEMLNDSAFQNPMPYSAIKVEDYDGLILPGGHAKGIRVFLESEVLQSRIVDFFAADKVVGAVCHGVVAAARSIDPNTGKSVLHGRKTTALLRKQELIAYNMTKPLMDDYFLTYPITVEEEVRAVLADPADFLSGKNPIRRDSMAKLKRGFSVRDGNYISARWPGDIYNFSLGFLELLRADT
ncbi:MAG: type 1 glutamine amidotransferase domain-containing protein [Rhodobacteraceae bacterium]|nr:type 1 glutamine amidotransferase domain-containing protein [Paracoccaceae bacterium]